MDLATTYMGLELRNPVIVGSSQLTSDMKSIRQCIDAGAGAIVLKSLFEEQIRIQAESSLEKSGEGDIYYWFPEAKDRVLGLSADARLDIYLDFISNLKKESEIPVIASINCITGKEWPRFAGAIQDAGADALELNIAAFPLDHSQESAEIEQKFYDIIREVKKQVEMPVSVKLGYYFTNLFELARRLAEEGVAGLVLFNRYFRPDLDIDALEIIADEFLSKPEETLIPLRWIALLKGIGLPCDLAGSTGIHTHREVIKHLLVGAAAVQVCSTLYINGNQHIREILDGLTGWMERNHFSRLDDFRGKALTKQTTNLSFERSQYMRRDFD